MKIVDTGLLNLFVKRDCFRVLKSASLDPMREENRIRNVLLQLKANLSKYKVSEYEFANYCNSNMAELRKLCLFLEKARLNIRWSAPAVFNPEMDDEIFPELRTAGCRKLTYDLFSGSPVLLRKFRVGFTIEDAERILNRSHKNGIMAGINLIFNHPQETPDDVNETLDFIRRNSFCISEVSKIRYCLSRYIKDNFSSFFELPLCANINECRGQGKECLKKTGHVSLVEYAADIAKIGKPIVSIEPNLAVLDYINRLNAYIIKRDKISLCFDNGKSRLFWEGKELTKGLGLYSSIFIGGFWQDSSQANWVINKSGESSISAKGKWYFSPIAQEWKIEILNQNYIKLDIEMEVLEDIIIDGEQQVNIMLTDGYQEWLVDNGPPGIFPNHFSKDWEIFFEQASSNSGWVAAQFDNRHFPAVGLKCDSKSPENIFSILNASELFTARVLKCYRNTKMKIYRGRYLYFSGGVKIDE